MSDHRSLRFHTPVESVLLHLIPGILTGACYFLMRPVVMRHGFPPVFALMVAVAVVIVPVEIGILVYRARRETSSGAFVAVIGYRRPLPAWQHIVWSALVFVVVGAVFTVMKPVDGFLKEYVFAWIPDLGPGLDGTYEKGRLIITYAAMVLFGVIAGPVTEELYFRGYLLPRMRGKLAVPLHSLLFAVYHVFTPWMVATRTVGLLPLIYAVRKKSILIGIIAHVVVNSIDAIVGISFIIGME